MFGQPDKDVIYTTKFMRLDRLSFSPVSEYSFNEWVELKSSEDFFASGSGSLYDRDGDFDGDGISNELEYVFDLDVFGKKKLTRNANVLQVLCESNSHSSRTHRRRDKEKI